MTEPIAFHAQKSRKNKKLYPFPEHSYSSHHQIKISSQRSRYWDTNGTRAPFFDRHELNQILQSYSRKVMSGEWLDYAMHHDETGAVFSIYGRMTSIPLFTIHKRDRPQKPEQRFQVHCRGTVLRSDRSLSAVLKFLEARTPTLVKG